MKNILLLLFFFGTFFSTIAQSTHVVKYDSSSLKEKDSFAVMPFNRIIKSAGKVITYGNPEIESHALDLAILPDNKNIVIEDRYGILVLDIKRQAITHQWSFQNDKRYARVMSTYSGIKSFSYDGHIYIVWSASGRDNHGGGGGTVMIAEWREDSIMNVTDIPIPAVAPATSSLPNDISIQFETNIPYLYVVLNGNNRLLKIRFTDKQLIWAAPTGEAPYGLSIVNNKAYVTNWAGPEVTDTTFEFAGTPWGRAYTNPVTGGTSRGSLSIIDIQSGKTVNELPFGLHPTAIITSKDNRYLYICNGNSDYITVVDVRKERIADSIQVGLFGGTTAYFGSSPNALQLDSKGSTLYVANGLDNAICVVRLGSKISANGVGKTVVKGFIPTEAYPGGISILNNNLYVANIEATGSHVLSSVKVVNEDDEGLVSEPAHAYTIHRELASLSIIPIPSDEKLRVYTQKVREQSLYSRIAMTNLPPRKNIAPKPMPERIGEPSVFKHVVYIIKENKTYDQVFGDLPQGKGMHQLCVYGDSVTPNQHQLVKNFLLMDNFYASGKCSAEGHQWADAAMVSDYIEKSVRAWFRSYPHRQEDALVYNKNGFIWNNALDHGKTVRVYGEACTTHWDNKLQWKDIYNGYLNHQDMGFTNTTTIARLRPIISPGYPDCDNLVFPDQIRAEIFINELKQHEQEPGDNLPALMVLSLPNDHTSGTSPNYPTPKAMIADNDLAVGKIIDAITHSRFWNSTVIFITEDDSQSGWDHISPYRTVGLVISPYSVMGKTIHTNYNQTCMVRSIEQILGIPPMNVIDATASPMFDCFNAEKNNFTYTFMPNKIPLDMMNKSLAELKGKASYFAKLSAEKVFKEVDGGEDDLMNRILWFDAKGDEKYPTARK
jgi:hypothetical protein